MTLTREKPELERPVRGLDDLVDYFRSAEKPRERWRVGTEHEKLGVLVDSLKPVPYEGERGIRALFELLVRDHGFAPVLEWELPIALEHGETRITLEPGGALELGGAPLFTLHDTCREFRDHVALMRHVSDELGIAWLGLGLQPFAALEDMPRVPGERYAIMRRVLAGRGELALHMMHMTGGVQANFDFASESDMARKLRLALAASPLVTAIFANSSISEGKPNGFESRRAWIWRYTDPARCGLLPFVFEPEWLAGGGYRRYAEWALDVPMFFIRRGGRHVDMRGTSFREHLARGAGEHRATLADWELHLTTLFPEARLKRVIETRSGDAVPPDLVCAIPALWKGLLYDEDALSAALERLRGFGHAELDALHAEVARRGLSARAPDDPVLALARDVVEIARAGLARIARDGGAGGEDETLLLDPIWRILDRGSSPGRRLVERWEGAWRRRPELLVEYARY